MAKEYKLDEYSEGILNIINQYKKTPSYKKEIEAIRKEAQKELLKKYINDNCGTLGEAMHIIKVSRLEEDLELLSKK